MLQQNLHGIQSSRPSYSLGQSNSYFNPETFIPHLDLSPRHHLSLDPSLPDSDWDLLVDEAFLVTSTYANTQLPYVLAERPDFSPYDYSNNLTPSYPTSSDEATSCLDWPVQEMSNSEFPSAIAPNTADVDEPLNPFMLNHNTVEQLVYGPTPTTSQPQHNHPVPTTKRLSRIEKRALNTQAARRYRQKQRDQVSGLEEDRTRQERDSFKVRVAELEGELKALRNLLHVSRS